MSYFFGNNFFGGNFWGNNMFHGGSTPTPTPPGPLTVLAEIIAARPRSGNNHGLSHNFITIFGGRPVTVIFYEPDPVSFHGDYYYNARENQLFKKLQTPDHRVVWKAVGEN